MSDEPGQHTTKAASLFFVALCSSSGSLAIAAHARSCGQIANEHACNRVENCAWDEINDKCIYWNPNDDRPYPRDCTRIKDFQECERYIECRYDGMENGGGRGCIAAK